MVALKARIKLTSDCLGFGARLTRGPSRKLVLRVRRLVPVSSTDVSSASSPLDDIPEVLKN